MVGMVENYLCIDVGTNSIRVLEKDSSGKVTRWGISETETPIHSAIEPLEPGRAALLLLEALDKMNTVSRDAIFAVPAFYSFTVIANEVDPGLIPAHPKTYFLWAYPARDGRYFLSATPRDVIDRYKILAKLAGLNFLGWEPESFSLARQFQKIKERTLIVDPDSRSTTFTLIDRGEVQYVFRTDFGGVSNLGTCPTHSLKGYVWDVIMNIAKEIAENKKVDQVLISNSVFNVPNGLQKISS